jgi:uncharacterized protein (TIGR02145 family)
MKGILYPLLLSYFCFLLNLPGTGFAEGTKQLMPDSTLPARILPAQGNVSGQQRDPFAIYNGTADYRLYIHIKDSTREKIYFGIGAIVSGGGAVTWRIHRPDGSVIYSTTTPTGGAGFISGFNRAVAGPSILNVNGYNALSVQPDVSGDYFMTFQIANNSSREFKFFDITVVDTITHAPIDGRVFSKNWQIRNPQVGPNWIHFFGKLFVYSNDGIVTKFDPNGFDGRDFSLACNESGCYPIGPTMPANQARKSAEGRHTYPEFRIFLNDPDSLVYPSGVLGTLVPNNPVCQGISNCNNGSITFVFQVTASGSTQILLSLSTLGLPYTDRILSQTVSAGWDTIIWDGMDGSAPPNAVPNGATFNFSLTYINGLTNLPLYDVENNASGFYVSLIRPVGSEPNFYWDDTGLSPLMTPGPSQNPPGGCTSSINPCHLWSGSDPGNERSVNTWWYISNTTTTPITITKKQKPGNLGSISGPNQFCQGANIQYWVTANIFSSKYIWTHPGGQDTTDIPSIIISIPPNAPPGPGQVSVYGYNILCGDGPISMMNITVLENPVVTNDPLSKDICSNTNAAVSLTGSVAGTTFSWIPTSLYPPITGYTIGSGTIINDLLVNNGNQPGIVDYSITPSASGCYGPVSHYLVTVEPISVITNNPPSVLVCSADSTNIVPTSNVAGATYTWTASGSSGNVTGFSSGSGNLIRQELINTGFSYEFVTYHITPRFNNCDGITADFTVTVYPVPDLTNTPAAKTICKGESTNVLLTSHVSGTLFTWTCTASSPNVTGYSNNAVPTMILGQILYNTGIIPETVTYHLTPYANGCQGPVTDFVITVNPKPVLTTNPMSENICSGTTTNINLTASTAGTSFSWTAVVASGIVTGFNPGAGSLINDLLTNTINTAGVVRYTISMIAAGCAGNDTNYFVTVNPTPHVTNAPMSENICSGASTGIVLTCDVAGAAFTWTATGSSPAVTGYLPGNGSSISQTLVNTGYAVETVTYHITPHANNCDGPVSDYIVTVFPVADVYYLPPSLTICSGLTTNIQVLSHVTGTSFTWVASGSSPNITGYSDGGGALISQVLTNSGIVDETVTYLVTPVANSCTGTPSSVVVTVHPTPHLTTAPTAQTICTGVTFSVNLLSSVAGSTYSWTCTPSSANLAGFLPGSGGVITQTLTNSGYTIETVTYHVTPAANGCSGPVTDYIVTVNPRPDVSNSPPVTQTCSGNTTNIILTSNVTGTTYAWTCTPSSANITGFSPGSGPVIAQTLINLGLNPEFVVYHITPTANGCSGNITDYTVNTAQVPDVYFSPTAQTLCSGQTTSIQNLSHVTGTSFAWTATASSPNITGYLPGVGNLIAQTLTNSGTTIETVTYAVAPSAFGCPPGAAQSVVVTVNPRPFITNPITSFQTCNLGMINIVLQSSVANTTYNWTASGSSPSVTGFSNGSGPAINQTLQNSGFAIETVTYGVTPVANGCPGTTAFFTVTVFPVADVYFTPAAQTLCSGMLSNINLASHVAGASFTWTASGSSPNVTGYTPGGGTLIQQLLNNLSYSIETVTYLASPTANGCPGTASSVIVTVDPLPVVTFTPCWDIITTTDAKPFRLKGGIPLGGNYSCTGCTGGFMNPPSMGPGAHIITYSYTNGFGCSAMTTQGISVIAPLPFTCGNTLTDVRDNAAYPTIVIGTQCWMAANLRYGNRINATHYQRDNCIPEKYESVAGGPETGVYQWDEMMQYENTSGIQGFCPPGWHVPTEADWGILFNYFISYGFAGSPLKYDGYSGFNAFLTGVEHQNVIWNFTNFATLFWSSSAHGTYKAWAHGLNSFDPSVSYYPSLRSNAFSVRCIKD